MKKLISLILVVIILSSCATTSKVQNRYDWKNGKARKMSRSEVPSCINAW
jgi:uncharacterized lipoprotein